MPEPVRIGIVGCGSVMARPYMAQIDRLRCQGRVEVVAACDIVEAKRDFVVKELGVPTFVTDYRELIQMDTVDLVMVLTSMPEHGPIAIAALETGKHVLVEKPMAVTLEEAARLVAVAQHSRGYLVCAPHIILSPTYQTIWQRVERGDIGRVHLARARYGWAGPWWGQWFYRSGGGPLYDLGVYNVTSLTGILGPAKRVMAMSGIAIPERVVDGEMITVETEDNFQIMLDFGDACFATITTGFTIQKYRSPAIELYGDQGTIQMMGDDWAPAGYELWQNELGSWQVFNETAPTWHWADGLRHLVECIQQRTRPIISPEHAYHVLEIMIRVQESSRDGQAKHVESTFTRPTFGEFADTKSAHLVHDRRY